MRCSSREQLYSGGFGSGKSWALCFKALSLAMQYPGIRILIGRARNPMLRQTTLRDFEELCPPLWITNHRKVEQRYELFNGSEILFRPLHNHGELRGLTVGAALVDEWTEVPEQSTQTLRGRLRQPGMPGILAGVTNPAGRLHYLYKDFVDPTERKRRGRSWFSASSLENTDTPEAYRESLLASYKGRDLQRFVEGAWIDPDTIVWDTLDRSTCVGPPPKLLPTWTFDTATDFGHDHWWVTLWGVWIQLDDGPRLLVYRQYWARRKRLEQHAKAIRTHTAEDHARGMRLGCHWSEHDKQTRHELRTMSDPGLRVETRAAAKAFVPGIRSVRGAFSSARDQWSRIILCAEQSPFSDRDAPDIVDQCESYQRPENEAREDVVLTHNSKGESIDDGCDALRYLWYSRAQDTFDRQVGYDPGMSEVQRRRLYMLQGS